MNIGFLCEGQTEQKIVDSYNFKELLKNLKITHCGTVNTKGSGKLLPKFLPTYTKQLSQMGAWKIFIITDSDKNTKKQVYEKICPDEKKHILIISIKKVESWFLSNDVTLKAITGITYAKFIQESKNRRNLSDNVEDLGNPYDQLEDIFNENPDFLDTSKLGIANEFIKHNFDIRNSNCNSAKYFIKKLEEIAKAEDNKTNEQVDNKNKKTTSKSKKNHKD